MMPDIGEIKRRRKIIGLTQKDIANMAGISQSMIAKVESGKVSPSYDIVKKIIEAMDSLGKEDKIAAKDIMTTKITSIKKSDKVQKVIEMMNRSSYSQIPVLDNGHPVGTVTERTVFELMSNAKNLPEILNSRIETVMEESLPTVKEDESIESVSTLLKTNPAVLVIKAGQVKGIIAKSDIFKIAKRS